MYDLTDSCKRGGTNRNEKTQSYLSGRNREKERERQTEVVRGKEGESGDEIERNRERGRERKTMKGWTEAI